MYESNQRKFVWGKPPNRRADLGGQVSDFSYLGGMRHGGFNASWPLVRLDLFPTGRRMLSSTRLLRGLVPQWEARFDELREVQAVGKIKWLSTGIRFRTERVDDWIVFWTIHRPRVLASIENFGVTVNPDPKRVYFFNAGR